MPLDLDYRHAAEAALASDHAASVAHAALFDLGRELGELIAQLQARSSPLPLHVRFVRQTPPRLDAPAGVHVEEAPKERPAGFARLALETRDLFFAIESVPGVAVGAVTNVPGLQPFAESICGVRVADDGKPHLLASMSAGVAVPPVHSAGPLLEAFLVMVADVFAARAAFNPLPDA